MNGKALVTGLAGLWLILTGLLGFSHLGYLLSNVIVGLTVTIGGFGLAQLKPRNGLAAVVLGLWVFISAFIHSLQSGPAALSNSVIVGALIAIAGLTAAGGNDQGARPPRTAGEGPPDDGTAQA